jgi:hypothetical protein
VTSGIKSKNEQKDRIDEKKKKKGKKKEVKAVGVAMQCD